MKGHEIAAVDPDAQAFVRDTTRPFVVEMVMALVTIARDPKTGARDRMKAAVRVIDYHLTAGRENADDSGQPRFGVVIVNGGDSAGLDAASDELRRLNAATKA